MNNLQANIFLLVYKADAFKFGYNLSVKAFGGRRLTRTELLEEAMNAGAKPNEQGHVTLADAIRTIQSDGKTMVLAGDIQ